MRFSARVILGLSLLVLAFTGCDKKAQAPNIRVTGFHANPAPTGARTGAVYFNLENLGQGEDLLLGGSSNVAQTVEIHQTLEKDGMMTMQRVEQLAIPAGGKVEFTSGGYHVMLIDLKKALAEGESISLDLDFKISGKVSLSVPVQAMGGALKAMEHMDHSQMNMAPEPVPVDGGIDQEQLDQMEQADESPVEPSMGNMDPSKMDM